MAETADLAAAVIVIELGVVENSTDLTDAVRAVVDAGVPHATRIHMAIRDAADEVLAVLLRAQSHRIPPVSTEEADHA